MQHSLWNMYSAIRNGSTANRRSIYHPMNSLCVQVLSVLYREGFINGFRRCPDDPRVLEIYLKYINSKPVINRIIPISKPGRRVYASIRTLWKLETSLSTLILSTPKGLFSSKRCRRLHQGGEVLCLIS